MRICLVSHAAYRALAGGESGHIGGVERQTSLMARWLAARGHTVTLITWDEGQADGVQIDGVTVRAVCRKDAGLPGLRFFHPKWTGLLRALERADAQVYYQNCAEVVTGQVALWCRKRGRRFVYSVASDPDCDPRLPVLMRRERVLYRIGLRRADKVIVQTVRQQSMLKEGFGIPSTVFPMPCSGPPDAGFRYPEPPSPSMKRVLWVGRLVEGKHPERLLDLAGMCPGVQFDLVGPEEDPELSRRIAERAGSLSNVTIHGPAERDRLAGFYARAHCLVSTSDYEGFPNTYLEAWSHGVPVAALVDPDGVITAMNLGVTATAMEGLAAGLVRLLDSPEEWSSASRQARAHYLANHTVDQVMLRFERAFLEEAAVLARVRELAMPGSSAL